VRVLRNAHDRADDWVKVRAEAPGPAGSRGIGCVVELWAGGSCRARRWIWAGGPFQSTSSTEAHFGVPAAWGDDLSVLVYWPLRREAGDVKPVRSAVGRDVRRGQAVTVGRDGGLREAAPSGSPGSP